MSFNKSFSELKFDKRMKDWNIKQGSVTEEEYKVHLESLLDLKDECEPFSLDESENKDLETETPDQPQELEEPLNT